MLRLFRNALPLKRALVSIVLVFSFLSQLACDRQGAVNLSKVGVETSTTLFSFYETLAQNTNDTRELQILWKALAKCEQDKTARVDANHAARTTTVNPNVRNHATSNPPAIANGKNRTPGAYLSPASVSPRSPAPLAASPNRNATPRSNLAPAQPEAKKCEGPTFPADHEEKTIKREQALRTRALMARQLANFLITLKTYSETDPGAKVEEAANKLGDAVASLVPVPGAEAAVPLLAGFAGDLKRWQQYKKIKKQMEVVQAGLSKLREFYDQEADAYTSIAQENSTYATAVLQELIKLEMVASWGAFRKLPQPYGMEWTEVVNEPEKREEFKKAFMQVIEFRNDRFAAHAEGATENLQEALAEFDSKITDFLNKKTISWDNALAALERAKFYVKEINNMRNAEEGQK